MPVRLSNINLFVADVARSVEVFVNALGMEYDQDRSAAPGFAFLRGGELSLTLQCVDTPGAVLDQSASVEIGFETDDLSQVKSALEAEGVEVQPIQGMGWGTAFDARDPNGIRLTVFTKK